MAKRRVKKRTHVGAKTGGAAPAPGNAPNKPGERSPKSMVIRIGASEVGPSVTQLVHDVRSMMEPETATRLKERRNNKLRDYTTMAGPLGVSHLLLFSRNSGSGNVNMRLAVTPRGPTLHFRVEKYSLAKDVLKSQKRPRTPGQNEFLAAPLLVMNNFSSQKDEAETNGEKPHQKIPKHLESLTTTIFQSLFPPINPTTTPLSNIKRILLLDRAPADPTSDSAQYTLNLRHYAIETRTAKSVPKALRRLDAAEKLSHTSQKRKKGGLPNLGKLNDVSDYMLDPHGADGFTSGSDSEPDTDAEVEVVAPAAQKVQNRKQAKNEKAANKDGNDSRGSNRAPNVEKKGIKLHELGPRLRLRLTKVEEGLCAGKVMWHEYINKSPEEIKQMDKVHEERRQEKERRRQEQKENVERKKKERRANGEEVEDEEDEDEDMDDLDDDEWDDEEDAGQDEDIDEQMGDGSDDEEGGG